MADDVYDDGRVRVDDDGITLRRYYFPTGAAKHIRFSDVRGVDLRTMGWLTGRGRAWGTSNPRYWLPLDADRGSRHLILILDLGRFVSPAFTPDEPERVRDLIERHRPRLS